MAQDCPICGASAIAYQIQSAEPEDRTPGLQKTAGRERAHHFKCPHCTEFVVTEMDDVNVSSQRSARHIEWMRLSVLLRERALHKRPLLWIRCMDGEYGRLDWRGPLVPINLDELLRQWPVSTSDRLDRALLNLAARYSTPGHKFLFERGETANVFAFAPEEADFHFEALIERGWVRRPQGHSTITADGWDRIESLRRDERKQTNPVFVAMAFRGDTESGKRAAMELFQNGIRTAVLDAGYLNAIRSDIDEHNNSVMDEVIARMRVAPFVVADFTGHRNGVYYEAGFARGFGTPVIPICHAAEIEEAHFDTSPLQHVLYESIDDLRQRLRMRIVATVGGGPDFSKTNEWFVRPKE